jgi:hypothetical protein
MEQVRRFGGIPSIGIIGAVEVRVFGNFAIYAFAVIWLQKKRQHRQGPRATPITAEIWLAAQISK